jgi:hypothetical protein
MEITDSLNYVRIAHRLLHGQVSVADSQLHLELRHRRDARGTRMKVKCAHELLLCIL